MRKRKGLGLFAVFVVVCLLLCACGGGNEPSAPSGTNDTKPAEVIKKKPVEVIETEPVEVIPPEPAETEPTYPQPLDNGITVLGGTAGVDGRHCANLFDGNDNTYWCVDMDANDRAYVEWSTPSPVEIYGIDIFTAEDSAMNPQVWKISYSADGQNWTELFSATDENNSITNAQTFYRNPIVIHNAADNYNVYVPTAQYFRLEVEQTQGSSMLKLRAFGIITEKLESASEQQPVEDKYPLTLANGITVIGGTLGVDGQDCENLLDGDDNTYWCVDMTQNAPAYVEWSTPSPVEIHGYDIFTAEDSNMNPQVWRLSYSADGQNWTDLYSATGENNKVTNAQTLYRTPIIFHNAADNYNVYVPTAQYFRLEVDQTQGSSMLKLRACGIITEELEAAE